MNKIKILIVEDDPNLGKILLEYLEVKNFEMNLRRALNAKNKKKK